MKNILLILTHEYLTRVKKKSFIIMTLLGPLLITLFYGAIIGLSVYQMKGTKSKTVLVMDPHHTLNGELPKRKDFQFQMASNLEESRKTLEDGKADMILNINSLKGDTVDLISNKSQSISDKEELQQILARNLFNAQLQKRGLSAEAIDSMQRRVSIHDRLISGENSASEVRSAVGFMGAFINYLFIFMYGVMIMRGVTEEKNNRIVEIIVSAVKPFELMMGKIIGVAMVGLTQFLSWIILSGVLFFIVSLVIGSSFAGSEDIAQLQQNMPQGGMPKTGGFGLELLAQLQALDYPKIIVGFIIFFLGGFLLYSGLFAAIGSAVDNETETQQFIFPVSMPLIFGFVIAQIAVLKDPNSTLAYWSSLVPFTSPVVMMVRLPFDVSWVEIIMSAIVLFGTFTFIVWLAGRIYKIGILSYGTKASYKKLLKWMFTK